MSDIRPNGTWWQASDGKWYPPELHADYTPFKAPTAPPQPGPITIGKAGSGPAAMAANNAKGVVGEQATAARLATLPTSYRVFHGLKLGNTKADIDHLVIGPSGVWVIDSKAWSGYLAEGKGMLWRFKTPIQKEIESVERQASYARSVLGCDTNPMLCFVGTVLPRPAQMVGRTRVVTLDALVPHLGSSPQVLTEHQVEAAFAAAQRWKVQPPPIAAQPRKTQARPAPIVRNMAPLANQTPGSEIQKKPSLFSRLPRPVRIAIVVVAVLWLFGVVQSVIAPGRTATTDDAAQGADTPLLPEAEPGQPSLTPSSIPDPGNFTAEVQCPAPGGGYTVQGRVSMFSGKIRVTSVRADVLQYLGEFRSFENAPPLTSIPPSSAVGFDIQPLDSSGQLDGSPYRIEIQTPSAPC